MLTSPQLPASRRRARQIEFAQLKRTLIGTVITVVLVLCVVMLPSHVGL